MKIPDEPIINLLRATGKPMNCVEMSKNSVMQAMPPGTPRMHALAKMRTLVNRGLVEKVSPEMYRLPLHPKEPDGIKCFLIEATGRYRRFLRRFVACRVGDDPKETERCPDGYHNAMTFIDEVEGAVEIDGDTWPHSDPRWPTRCGCGYLFAEMDTWQVFKEEVYRRMDTGEDTTLPDAPPGAIWRATWYEGAPELVGPDGRSYVVRLPNGIDWMMDSRCSNCTKPKEPHKCWVRTGEAPNFDVTKGRPGESCDAGAGSIWSNQGGPKDWHGFLRHGRLVKA